MTKKNSQTNPVKRGATFVGFRPTSFQDKAKYNRKREKQQWKRDCDNAR